MVGVKEWFMGLVAVGMLVPSAGAAQAAKGKKATVDAPVEIEEIVVTAQKREENLQETLSPSRPSAPPPWKSEAWPISPS